MCANRVVPTIYGNKIPVPISKDSKSSHCLIIFYCSSMDKVLRFEGMLVHRGFYVPEEQLDRPVFSPQPEMVIIIKLCESIQPHKLEFGR